MKLEFSNGVTKKCRPPVEQKLFSNGVPSGWLLSVRITEQIDSSGLDELLGGGVDTLTFKDSEGLTLFVLTGYEKAISCSVRYGESNEEFSAEIQLTKGVNLHGKL